MFPQERLPLPAHRERPEARELQQPGGRGQPRPGARADQQDELPSEARQAATSPLFVFVLIRVC